MQLATVAELADWLNVTIDPTSTRAVLLLQAASAQVDTWCNQYAFERTVDDTIRLRGLHGDQLELPGRPVESVTSVTVDGDGVTDWTLVGDVLWRAGWGGPSITVEVVYTHGYATVPNDVKSVVLEAAGRAWSSGAGIAQESIGSYSVTYIRESAGVALLPQEREQLADAGYRRTSASVTP